MFEEQDLSGVVEDERAGGDGEASLGGSHTPAAKTWWHCAPDRGHELLQHSMSITFSSRVQCASKTTMATTETIAVPKRITNAQTVCNEKNEKGKLCNGHLKQLRTAGEPAQVHLRGDDVLSKCQTCGTLYMGPPLGHVRDPRKQVRFVEAELTALLQAAGGTLPVIKKDEERGVYVMVETVAGDHGSHAAKPAPAKAAAPAAPKAAASATPAAPKTAAPAAPAAPKAGGAGAQP